MSLENLLLLSSSVGNYGQGNLVAVKPRNRKKREHIHIPVSSSAVVPVSSFSAATDAPVLETYTIRCAAVDSELSQDPPHTSEKFTTWQTSFGEQAEERKQLLPKKFASDVHGEQGTTTEDSAVVFAGYSSGNVDEKDETVASPSKKRKVLKTYSDITP